MKNDALLIDSCSKYLKKQRSRPHPAFCIAKVSCNFYHNVTLPRNALQQSVGRHSWRKASWIFRSLRTQANVGMEQSTLCQGRTEVKWGRGQGTSLATPCSNVRYFGSKVAALKKVLATSLGLFGALPLIQRPGHCIVLYCLLQKPGAMQ